MPIEKYLELVDDCMQYADDYKQPYTADQIINNAYTTILDMDLYTEPINIWTKNLSSDKKWAGIKKLFAEEYHDLCEL